MATIADSRYDVRGYRPADRDGFLSLYEQVWGHAKGEAWFAWRFEENPYAAGVEMVVAERDGRIVGAEALLPLRLRLGDRELAAYEPVDWVVHPDHRRQGLFTRMTERLLERYAGRADLLFNFPSEMLLPGVRKFEWAVVGEVPQYYRVQRPRALLAHRRGPEADRWASLAAAVSGPVVAGYLGVRDRLCRTPGDVAVETHESVPVLDLVEIAARDRPRRLHVARNRAFYGWRFANPRWETTTYLARRAGEPVAALVAATERRAGVRATYLLDVQPMAAGAGQTRAVAALVDAVLADNRDVDLLKATATDHGAVLRERGFLRDDEFPLSRLATQTTQVVRPLAAEGDPRWRVGGRDLTDPDAWTLSLADLDVA